MIRKVELLSPAGSYDSFISAINNGADAVYLGGPLFNARANAANFTREEIEKVIYYAHVRGVRIYLTMNTLISDLEMNEAFEFTAWAYNKGIDGVIVQDLGFASLLKKNIPGITLHGSTQMTIYNVQGARALRDMGFSRVIPARELTLDENRDIVENGGLDVEVFVHGALCICYSGQCLMSSVIGGRSGNRGLCAQPCRLPYRLFKDNQKVIDESHMLSPKDLCLLHEIPELIGAGVASFKIEGRMKSPEYVGIVTSVYRKYIDFVLEHGPEGGLGIDEEDDRNLLRIFNREGFTRGYLYGKTGREMISSRSPKNTGIFLGKAVSCDRKAGIITLRLKDRLSEGDGIEIRSRRIKEKGMTVTRLLANGKRVINAKAGDMVSIAGVKSELCEKDAEIYKTYDSQLYKEIAPALKEDYEGRKVKIKATVKINPGEPAELVIRDGDSNEVVVQSEAPVEIAGSKPLAEEMVVRQLQKTGGTPFEFTEIKVYMGKNVFIPVSALNRLRRDAFEKLANMRAGMAIKDRAVAVTTFNSPQKTSRESGLVELSVSMPGIFKGIEDIARLADRIYIPVETFADDGSREYLTALGRYTELWLRIPPMTRGIKAKMAEKVLDSCKEGDISGVLVGNLGFVELVKKRGLRISADYNFNVYNSFTINGLEKLGFERTALSVEMTLEEMKVSAGYSNLKLQAMVYGRIPLMTTEYCPVGGVCAKCDNPFDCGRNRFYLTDRYGVRFPVRTDKISCQTTVYNSKVIFVPEVINELAEAGVCDFRIDFTDEKPERMRDIMSLYRYETGKDAKPGFYDELIDEIKSEGFTRGHYFRGV